MQHSQEVLQCTVSHSTEVSHKGRVSQPSVTETESPNSTTSLLTLGNHSGLGDVYFLVAVPSVAAPLL